MALSSPFPNATRAVWLIAAAAIAILAISSSLVRDSQGVVSGAICLPLAVAFGVAATGLSHRRPWAAAARWTALLAAGFAATLQWMDAGPAIHYQHYRPWLTIVTEHPLTAALFALQTALTASAFWKRRRSVTALLHAVQLNWRVAVVAAIGLGTLVAASRDILLFAQELTLAILVQTVHLATLILAVSALPPETSRWIAGYFEPRPQSGSRGLDRFAWTAATLVALAAAGLNYFVYERHPHVPDEVSYLYQARYFAEGKLSAPAPPASDAFNVDLMTYERDRWFSPFPPGWPMALAIGVRFGFAWLVNPLLAGISVLLAYLFFQELLTRGEARLGVVLLVCSPWHLFMAMSFMSHTFTLACALLAALGIARSSRTGSIGWALAAGLATGQISLIRPLDAAILGVALGLWAIGVGGKRLRLPALAAFGIATAAIGALSLPYNRALTGDPSLAPVMDYFNRYYAKGVNDLGFGPSRGLPWAFDPFPGHSPLDAIVNANLNAASINWELFGWPAGSLLFVLIAGCARVRQRVDYLMAAVIALDIGLFSLYWFAGGPDFGARYWFLTLIPCVVLTLRGHFAAERLAGIGQGRATAAVLVLCALAVWIYVPWRAADKYSGYLNMRSDVRTIAETGKFNGALVLVRGRRHPDYASAAIYNSLDFGSGSAVYAWDKDMAARREARRAFPNRPVWILEGPTITNSGYRIAAGPLPPDSPQLER